VSSLLNIGFTRNGLILNSAGAHDETPGSFVSISVT
jgi:hypothetical protein